MARCFLCVEETEIYDGGDVPICRECLDIREAKRKPSATQQHVCDYTPLFHDFLEATAQYHEATKEFEAVMGKSRSGSPHPQRIKNVSSVLALARKKMMMTYNLLNEYIASHQGATLRRVS